MTQIFICMALILAVVTAGCTSSEQDTGSSAAAADPGEFHSSFAPMAGTDVSSGDPSSSIILDPTGAVRIVTGSSSMDTSISMEMDVIRLADETNIGPYPIQDETHIYDGVNTGNRPDPFLFSPSLLAPEENLPV